jgi:putative ABC transport system permease protein
VEHPLSVQGIYEKDALAGAYTISDKLFRTSGADQLYVAVFGKAASGVSQAKLLAAVKTVTKEYPTGKLLSRADYIKAQAKQLDQFVNLVYGLLALAVVIAIFGITNTLSLSVYERTRELGLLRAVGAYQSQVRSAVRWESIITALLGTAQGIVIGVLLGYAVIVSLRSEGSLRFTLPITTLIVVVVPPNSTSFAHSRGTKRKRDHGQDVDCGTRSVSGRGTCWSARRERATSSSPGSAGLVSIR